MRHALALIPALLLLPGAQAAEPPSDSPSPKYPRIFRTFMPEAGPSAFAVELSPKLSLCYDPLRGGVNQVWSGTIDLSPTWQAKINQPAKIVGPVFYRETGKHPLRLSGSASAPRRRSRAYHYEEGAVAFEFTLGGRPVTETLRASEDGRSLLREFKLPAGSAPAFFRLEAQPDADVKVSGGKEVEPGLWQFAPGSPLTLLITPKKGTPR